MDKKGQIINKSKSKGLGVCETWVALFKMNEIRFRKGSERVLTDEQITKAMLKVFPERKDSKILHLPNKVRGRYNRGILTQGKKPKLRSCKYVKNGTGKPTRIKLKKKGD